MTQVESAPIFIVGHGRSGTSVLRSLLNAHPRIHLTQETMFYLSTQARPFWVSAERRLEFYFRSFSFAWQRLDPELIRRQLPRPLSRAHLGEAYRVIMREAAARHGKERYGDKNPLNSPFLGRIFRHFPDARVVEIVRDPRAVALSLTRMPFGTSSLALIARGLAAHERRMRRYRDRILTVRMEDLVAKPRPVLEKVLDFVGEPWDEAMMDPARQEESNADLPFPWLRIVPLERWGGSPSWSERLDPAWIRILERSSRPAMAAFGYPPAELAAEPSAWARTRARLADLPEALRTIRHFAHTARRIALPPRADAAEIQRLVHSANPRAWLHHPDWTIPDPPTVPGR